MKMTMEVDCTPEEARRFLGLPDISKANEVYVENISKAMQGVTSIEQLQGYVKQIAPMGEMGLKMFQQFMEQGGMGAMSGAFSGKKPKD